MCLILVTHHSFKMRDQKDFGPDRMLTFDVSIELDVESDSTMGEVFFAVELSTKPKSFMVSKAWIRVRKLAIHVFECGHNPMVR